MTLFGDRKESIYNEASYLDGDIYIIRFFEACYRDNKEKWEEESVLFSNVIKNYHLFIEQVAKFIKSFGYKSSIEGSMILSFLINNGYLSTDLLFEDEAPNFEEEITSSMGTSIVRGAGCCRNYSQMHQEVFEQLGLFAEKFYCYQGFNTFNKALNARANHVISLIEHDGILYGIDLYNGDRLYRFKEPFVLSELSPTSNGFLRYKPYYEITQGESNLDQIIKKLDVFASNCTKRYMNPFDYEDRFRFEIKRRLRRKESEMFDFHESTKVLKKEISSEIDEILKRR